MKYQIRPGRSDSGVDSPGILQLHLQKLKSSVGEDPLNISMGGAAAAGAEDQATLVQAVLGQVTAHKSRYAGYKHPCRHFLSTVLSTLLGCVAPLGPDGLTAPRAAGHRARRPQTATAT